MHLAETIGQLLTERGLTLAVAESCTGGLLGHLITNVSGSSAYFPGGIICYSNEAKRAYVGVRAESLDKHGAVSAEVAVEMASGVRQAFDTDIGIAITGIAGPGGGREDKPVGLVYIALADAAGTQVWRFVWQHDRVGNKVASAEAALALLHEHLTGGPRMPAMSNNDLTVEAQFRADGSVHPLALIRGGRRERITDWGRQWRDDAGCQHFLVMTSPTMVLELIFDPRGPQWRAEARSSNQPQVA
jgi:nicotinamide-nucleotide amidase